MIHGTVCLIVHLYLAEGRLNAALSALKLQIKISTIVRVVIAVGRRWGAADAWNLLLTGCSFAIKLKKCSMAEQHFPRLKNSVDISPRVCNLLRRSSLLNSFLSIPSSSFPVCRDPPPVIAAPAAEARCSLTDGTPDQPTFNRTMKTITP